MAETDSPESAFEPIVNPYVIGNPIRKGEPFFGRESDFEFARRRLEAEREGVVLLFVGGRRSGKTSIMVQILDGRLGDEFVPVFIDMQQLAGIHGDQEMLGRMARTVIDNIGDERLVADYYDFAVGNPILTFDRLLADINQIFPDKRLLFLVDEAELLRDKVNREEISSSIITFMASALESRRVSYFFTGSAGLADADVAEWKRLMGKGDFREISFLSRQDTKRLATEPVAGRVQYADGVLETIYQLTYGQPFYTQLICTNAVDLLNSHQRYTLTVEDLDEVVRTIVNNPPPTLVYDWEQFTHEEQLALSLLSEVCTAPHKPVDVDELGASIQENEYPLEVTVTDLHVVLDGLDGKMVLERSDDDGFHFRVDLVRQWVRRNRSVWRLVEEREPEAPSRRRWVLPAAAAGVLVVVAAAAVLMLRPGATSGPEPVSAPRVGSVWIDRFPPGTQVTLRGPLDGPGEPQVVRRQESRTLIDGQLPGLYEAVLEHPLHARRVDTVRVVAGQRDTVAGQLVRLVGRLVVRPAQPQARIVIRNGDEGVDTSAVGALSSAGLPTGSYEVEVTRAGFKAWRAAAVVRAGETDTLLPDLAADVGALVVLSTPPGATVTADGRQVGTTPLVLPNLPTGPHTVRVELEQHQARTATRQVSFGRRDTLRVELALLPAELALNSNPSGARIWLDGDPLADRLTPTRVSRSPGVCRVRLELTGYDPHEESLELVPGGELELAAELVRQFGYVKIIRPLWGTLIVDGERDKYGVLNVRRLSVGAHELELEEKDGLKSVQVTKNDTIPLTWD